MKYKVMNKTFSPLSLYEIGIIPKRSYIIMETIPNSLRILQKNKKIEIKKIS